MVQEAQVSMFLHKHGFWFRIFGYGLNIKLRSKHIVVFSERYGHRKVHYFGPLVWEMLRP